MEISRTTLIKVLKYAQPALSSIKNQVAELSHFWFDGETVSAFDDILGIKLSFKTDFTGGIPGDQLLGVLENSRARTVTITPDKDGNLLMKIASAKVTFASKPIEDWFWKPEVPDTDGFEITQEFLSGLDLTLLSVGATKILSPEQRGVTVMQNGGTADLFSTDAITLSWMEVATKQRILPPGEERCILPTPFCEQLKRIARPGAELRFDANQVYCTARVSISGEDDKEKNKADKIVADVMLFSRLVEDDNPVQFKEHLDRYLDGIEQPFAIPSRFRISVDRAMVLLSEKEPIELAIEDGHLFLEARGENTGSEIKDNLELKESKHGDISVRVDAGRLKRGLDGRDHMSITEDCLIMSGPKKFYHIVSTK